MEYILSLCTICLEFLSLKNFGDSFLNQNRSRKFFLLYLIYIPAIFLLVNFTFKDNTTLKFVIMMLANIVVYLILYKNKTILKVVLSIISYFTILAFDYLFILIFFKAFHINYSTLIASPTAYCITTVLSKFSLFSVSYIVKTISKTKFTDHFDREYFYLSIFFPLFSLITLLILFNVTITFDINSYWIIFDVFGILIANLFIVKILQKMNHDSKIKRESIILEQRLKSEIKNLELIKTMYEQQRKLSHDFNNHLHIINELATQHNSMEIMDYTKELLTNVSSQSMIINTHNHTINAIINQKFYRAQSLGISMRFEMNDLHEFPLTKNDCVTILANALDNAIEAASNSLDKVIKVKIKNDSSTTIISIINSSNFVQIEDNDIITAKKADITHGYGLKNIKSTLSKYNHIFAINYNSGFFQMTIIINK